MDAASKASSLGAAESFARPPPASAGGVGRRRTGGRKARFAETVAARRSDGLKCLFDASAVLETSVPPSWTIDATQKRKKGRPVPSALGAASFANGGPQRPPVAPTDGAAKGFSAMLSGAWGLDAKRDHVEDDDAAVDAAVDEGEAPVPDVHDADDSAAEAVPPLASQRPDASDLNVDAISAFGIYTGDDAINFFSSQAGSQSSIKFVHLMQVDAVPAVLQLAEATAAAQHSDGARSVEAKTFRPYDLMAVRASGAALARMKCAYYTMSSEGLVLMAPGDASEFIPLTQWMRESACFNMLTSIHFFRNYLRIKCFHAWRANVSFLQFARQRRHLRDRLFVGMPSFCAPLLELRRHMAELQNVKLLEHGVRTFEVPSFIDRQAVARTEAAKQLDACLEQAAASVYAVCKEVTTLAKPIQAANAKHDKPTSDEPMSPRSRRAARVEVDVVSRVILQMEASEKPKSMAALREQDFDRKQKLRRAAHECRLLPEFVRLADYVAVEALVVLMVSTWAVFLAELLRPRRQCGLLETTIRFSEGGSTFSPTCSSIQDVLGKTADSLIGMLGTVIRILYLRPLAQYLPAAITAVTAAASSTLPSPSAVLLQSPSNTQAALQAPQQASSASGLSAKPMSKSQKSAPNVQDIIRNDAQFKATALAINQKVEADFRKAQEYVAAAFEKVWPIFDYSRKWDFESYKRQAHTVASLKKEMEKVAGWEKEMEKMRTRQTCGLLEVESRKLRCMLIPMTSEKMEALKDLVKDLSRAKCKDQRNKYKSAIAKIAPRPMHLGGFTVLLERVEEQRLQSRSLFKHTQIVEQMYQMLSHHEVKIADGDLVQLDELRSVQVNYADELESCQSFRDDRLAEMKAALDGTAAKCDDAVSAVVSDLEVGAFVDETRMGQPSTVLSELQVIRSRLDALILQDAAHRKHCKLFSMTAPSPNVLDEKKTDLGVKGGKKGAPKKAEVAVKGVDAALEKVDRVRTLWTMVERWEEDYSGWVNDFFLTQNANAIDRDVHLYSRGAANLGKKLQNAVVLKLIGVTAKLRDTMPLVKLLGHASLKPHHWQSVFELLKQPCPADLNFTLDMLLRFGILNHAEFIKELVASATAELQHEEVRLTMDELLGRVDLKARRDEAFEKADRGE
ncbi:dynein heavy chain, N-terminal region 2-domain-containing protein [Pelagophyceae sp. CCMP2097]|nr:dynein heavy chain, N-terminal region 2-domain-containing protein [Pelagophyceae sp. CCMP2097]